MASKRDDQELVSYISVLQEIHSASLLCKHTLLGLKRDFPLTQ